MSIEKFIQSLGNQQLVLYQIITEIPTVLCNEEPSVFGKAINGTNKTAYRTFGLGRRKRKNKPSWVKVEFMHNEKIVSQLHDSSEFDWLPLSSAVCRKGSHRYPENLFT